MKRFPRPLTLACTVVLLISLFASNAKLPESAVLASGVNQNEQIAEEATVTAAEHVLPAVAAIHGKIQDKSMVVGAAFFVTTDGWLITCDHVIQGNQAQLKLKLRTGQSAVAKVVLRAPGHDLAVLKIVAPGNWPALALAATPVKVGSTVLAVGHPRTEAWSVSKGIISAASRDIELPAVKLTGLIQTDAPINSGNSGGPLVNLKGEVVGVVCATNTFADGVSYAVSAKTVQVVLARAKELQ